MLNVSESRLFALHFREAVSYESEDVREGTTGMGIAIVQGGNLIPKKQLSDLKLDPTSNGHDAGRLPRGLHFSVTLFTRQRGLRLRKALSASASSRPNSLASLVMSDSGKGKYTMMNSFISMLDSLWSLRHTDRHPKLVLPQLRRYRNRKCIVAWNATHVNGRVVLVSNANQHVAESRVWRIRNGQSHQNSVAVVIGIHDVQVGRHRDSVRGVLLDSPNFHGALLRCILQSEHADEEQQGRERG